MPGSPGMFADCPVNADNIEACRNAVASGRWVIVDPQPQEEQGQ